jgi:hypothetical protein
VNSAPAGADKTVGLFQNGTYRFKTADFGFTDVDGNTLQAVKIATLPAAGSLSLNSSVVNAGDFISAADLTNLVYTPAANATGSPYSSFTFQVQDNGGTADGGVDVASPNTLTFNVLEVGLISAQTYTDSAIEPTVTIAGATFTVSYSNNTNLGTATVSITGTDSFVGANATTTFQIVPGAISIGSGGSLLSGSNLNLIANGSEAATINVQLKDGFGNNISQENVKVTFSTTLGTFNLADGIASTNASGLATITLTSTTSGTANVTSTITDPATGVITNGSPVSVVFTAGLATIANTTVTASSGSILANGITTSTISIQLKDANGNNTSDLGGKELSLTTDKGTLQGSLSTSGSGLYTQNLKSSTTAETATLTAKLDAVSVTDNATVEFTAGPISVAATGTKITGTNLSLLADGTEGANISVQLKDVNGNNISQSGLTVQFSTTIGTFYVDGNISSIALTDANGVASGVLKSTFAGTANVTAKLDHDNNPGTALLSITNSSPVSVTFNSGAVSASTSTVTASPASIVADNSTTSTITVTLKDANNNPVSGKTVSLADNSATSTISAASGSSDASGVVTFSVKNTIAETVTYTARGDDVLITGTATVAYTAGAVSASTSTVTASPASIVADNSTTSTITVTLKDANNNPVSGKTVSLADNSATSTISAASGSSDASGVVTFSVKNTIAETVTYTATGDDVLITGTATVEFTAGTATASAITTQPVGAASGLALGTQPVIRIVDASGNTVTGSSVNVVASIASGTGTLSGTTTIAAVNGIATFTDLVITGTAGDYTLTFTPAGLTAVTSSALTITAGTATASAITTQPVGAASGLALGTQPVIRIIDANGNTVTGSSVNVVASIASGTGTLSGTTTIAAVNGIATFTDLVITGTAGDYTLTFTPAGLTAVTSSALTITAGTATAVSHYYSTGRCCKWSGPWNSACHPHR